MGRRRKFFSRAARHIEGLPDDFTPVSFLQSSGSQYIDTGRKLTQDSDITIDFRIVGELYRNAGIFGSRESAPKNNLTLFQNNMSTLSGDFSEYQNHRFTTAASSERTKIRMNKSGAWVNNILKKSWGGVADFETPTNGLIFDVGNNNWAERKAIMRLYGYTDGNAQRLVPCLDANGVPCLYDLIGKTALYNQGAGSFTWG
jgi:hypothetical protein|uniref:Uncharacterized protein n=1 Tax=Siphoviridae sp. ct9UA16 TaxID=2827793 RepID=A0A8S5TMI0_9CAUD|nr:MAG TPA: hypothetical protein [Siphoviridae sp. ct9UA16]